MGVRNRNKPVFLWFSPTTWGICIYLLYDIAPYHIVYPNRIVLKMGKRHLFDIAIFHTDIM